MIKYEPIEKFYYYTILSENGGDTLSSPIQISEEVFNINHADDKYFYALNYSFRKHRAMYYKFDDIFSQPIDSADLGFANDVYSYVNSKGEKYVLFEDSKHISYFIGKDIITSVKQEFESNPGKNEIRLSVSPNPFNSTSILSFSLPKQGRVNIIIYDISGKRVKEMQNYTANSGENKITFNADNLASGTYIITLRYNNATYTAKALLVK